MAKTETLPKRGDKPEWQHTQDYWAEKKQIPGIDLEGGAWLGQGSSTGC